MQITTLLAGLISLSLTQIQKILFRSTSVTTLLLCQFCKDFFHQKEVRLPGEDVS